MTENVNKLHREAISLYAGLMDFVAKTHIVVSV